MRRLGPVQIPGAGFAKSRFLNHSEYSDQTHLGTSVYEPADPGFECEGFVHHPPSGCKKLYTAPFSPNSVFGFVRSNRSFHGREPISDVGVERNLLIYII